MSDRIEPAKADADPGSATSQPSAATDQMPLLRAEGVGVRFGGVHALDDVDFTLLPGRCAALVGDNGAGKSTFVKVLSGALRPDEGRITFAGEEVVLNSPSEAQALGIQTMHQTLALVDQFDAVHNIFLGRELFRVKAGWLSILDRKKMTEKAEAMLARTGVKVPSLTQPVGSLSGGQRQGVVIARAAGWGSRLIIMDEPTAALGVQETARVEAIIRGLRDEGVAVLLVSHNLRQVFDLADDIWVLRRGRMAGHLEKNKCVPNDVVRLITGLDEVSQFEYV